MGTSGRPLPSYGDCEVANVAGRMQPLAGQVDDLGRPLRALEGIDTCPESAAVTWLYLLAAGRLQQGPRLLATQKRQPSALVSVVMLEAGACAADAQDRCTSNVCQHRRYLHHPALHQALHDTIAPRRAEDKSLLVLHRL